MKFPTYEEMAKNVAEKALDEIEYEGKTLREWVKIILDTDTNVATKVGTNLAEVGTDCISRQTAIDAFDTNIDELVVSGKENADAVERYLNRVIDEIKQLPPIQPKRGKWIDKGITGDWQYQIDGRGRSWHEWQCDQCKDMVKKRSFYCPNCGADMRGGENDGCSQVFEREESDV